MPNRYLLYIDVLGFSELVQKGYARVNDLYEVVASLNVHKHPAFRAIVFSDTILVYNVVSSKRRQDRSYLLMYLCEFAQDLLHRLAGRGIVFRAVLVQGEFTHYQLNSIPCFFGPALIDAYRSEKGIKAIGLFMDRALLKDSDIFRTMPFTERFSFVFLTQSLETIEHQYGADFPIDAWLLEETDLIWQLTPELLLLKYIYEGRYSNLTEDVCLRYANTWHLFKQQYPRTTQHLEHTNFDFDKISPRAIWAKVLQRFPEDYSWAVKQKEEF